MTEDHPIDDEDLELTAATAWLGLQSELVVEPLPEHLRARLESDAWTFFKTHESRSPRIWKLAACVGWLAAAASWIAMAGFFWQSGRDKNPSKPSIATSWTAALKASDHPLANGAGGELVWDQISQSGSLRLEGLAGVDPRKGVYQLWIFDAKRDPRYPVDGGTFTISDASTQTVVPVRASLPVSAPTLFAITLEPPGGVVVSDRERIMLTASYP